MSIARSALLAALSLLLLPLAAFVPAAAAPKCVELRTGDEVCHDDARGPCVWATQFDAATDFGTIEKACVTGSPVPGGGRVACAQTVAGAGTYGGFFGHHQTTCAAATLSASGACVFAWGDAQDVAWQLAQPLCVPFETQPVLP